MTDPFSLSSSSAAINAASGGGPSFVSAWIAGVRRRYQHLLDKWTPHVLRRWVGFGLLALVYVVRIAIIQRFYIVSYCLGLYAIFLLFKFLPETEDVVDGSVPTLPATSSDEFRPFVPRLPEFKLWYSITKACCISFVFTFVGAFDVPAFWQPLVFYWFVLLICITRRPLVDMIKYKFTTGKKRYGKKIQSAEDLTCPRTWMGHMSCVSVDEAVYVAMC